ncbi:alpha/beta hydrolase [Ideonella sp. B7]|uniref:alpha/beta fold hydrolase n=1 Tax=Ideonella benzenivorans TaxID=2831643 RepID=UPI001CECC649|nr:alpha/beta hydrolase [Ideonella benzenivorans]MCA6217392.1 alpha/beta hydrolase [Ideonella benzenivorans]
MELTVDHRHVHLACWEPAAPAARTLLLLHGALNDHSVWNALGGACAAAGHRALAPDLPAHGGSAGPLQPDIDALADWALRVADAAGVARLSVAGHSMGSLIALALAARAPERIDHLLLLGTAFPMRVSPALLASAEATPEAGMDLVNTFSYSPAAVAQSDGPLAEARAASRALMAHTQAGCTDGNLFLHDFQLCDRYTGGLEAAARVRCPVTLIQADADRMTPAKATVALLEVLNADVRMVPGGHAMLQEQPEAVAQAVLDALA